MDTHTQTQRHKSQSPKIELIQVLVRYSDDIMLSKSFYHVNTLLVLPQTKMIPGSTSQKTVVIG
jgi:hypothetical protein